jgi:hypothetical protein
MKTTNEMIADLQAAGLELPEGLAHREGHWKRARAMHGFPDLGGYYPLPDQQAYDLIACAFARQVDTQRRIVTPFVSMRPNGVTIQRQPSRCSGKLCAMSKAGQNKIVGRCPTCGNRVRESEAEWAYHGIAIGWKPTHPGCPSQENKADNEAG